MRNGRTNCALGGGKKEGRNNRLFLLSRVLKFVGGPHVPGFSSKRRRLRSWIRISDSLPHNQRVVRKPDFYTHIISTEKLHYQ